MNIVRHRPAFGLAAWVDCFWYRMGEPATHEVSNRASRSHSGIGARCSALPTGGMDVVFNLHQDRFEVLLPGGRASVCTDGALVHGAQSSYFVIAARARGATAGIHFRPGGGAVLLGLPASELTDQHVALTDLWGEHAGRLRTQLLECDSPAQIFQAMQQALLDRLRARQVPLVHPAISFALRNFAAPAGISRVTPIQRATGYSARRFNTLFQQAVGLVPKRFCRIQRLRAVVEQVARGEPIEWARLAVDNGYFDQSHLNRDFRLFSGVTPAQYRPVARDSALHMKL